MKPPSMRAILHVGPIAVLAIALGLLLFKSVPVPNKELVASIIAGLLTYLTRPPAAPPPARDPEK